jgi:hypothetical protein
LNADAADVNNDSADLRQLQLESAASALHFLEHSLWLDRRLTPRRFEASGQHLNQQIWKIVDATIQPPRSPRELNTDAADLKNNAADLRQLQFKSAASVLKFL